VAKANVAQALLKSATVGITKVRVIAAHARLITLPYKKHAVAPYKKRADGPPLAPLAAATTLAPSGAEVCLPPMLETASNIFRKTRTWWDVARFTVTLT